jgi:protein subunit release factor A
VRTLRRRLEEIERQIHDLEARLREFAEVLSDPELYKDGDRVRTVATERKTAEEQVAWLMREWEELSVELSAHE